jgi:WD domain, G-beta repeat/TIR domain
VSGKIFLNYRRGDDAGTVGRLFDRLEQTFPRDQLFMDVEGHIKAGDDYVDVLRRQVGECDVLLVVIGPRWLTITDETGRRRLDNPDDWVRVEIVSALQAGVKKRVIPVLVPGAEMPRAEDLPGDLKPLARKQAVRVTLERFKADAQGLVTQVTGVLVDLEAARAAASVAEQAAAEEALRRHEAEEATRATEVEARGSAQRLAGMSADDVRKAEELASWDFIKTREDVHELRDHLARFPGGVTARYAKTRLEELVWRTLAPSAQLTSVDTSELSAYLEEFPGSAHAAEGKGEIARRESEAAASMMEEEKRAEETAAWAAVAASQDKAAVGAFLNAWPHGQHEAAAKARLRELRGGRFSRRALLKGIGYGVGGTAVVGAAAAATLVPGMPLWRLLHDKSVRTLSGHSSGVKTVAIAPDGKTIVSGGWDNTLKVWDLASGRDLRTLSGHSAIINAVAVAPDGKSIVSGGDDNTVKVWDLGSGRELRTLPKQPRSIEAVAITPDGKAIVSGSYDNTLKIWDLASGREIRTLSSPSGSNSIYAVAITPDGKAILSAGHENKIWDLASGRALRTLLNPDIPAIGSTAIPAQSVAITPDGKTVVLVIFNTFYFFDVPSGRPIRTLSTRASFIDAFAITPDGKTLVSGSEDGTIKIWDLVSGLELRTLLGHLSPVRAVAITPDGKTLVSGSGDATLKVWDLAQ